MVVIEEKTLRCNQTDVCEICNPSNGQRSLFATSKPDQVDLVRLYRHHVDVLSHRGVKGLELSRIYMLNEKRCVDPLCIYCNPVNESQKTCGYWKQQKDKHQDTINKAVENYLVSQWEPSEQMTNAIGTTWLHGERYVIAKTEDKRKYQLINVKVFIS